MYGRISGALVLAALLAAGAIFVAGCGGGEDTAEATATLSKSEFAAQAHAICAKNRKDREAVLNRYYDKAGGGNEKASFEALLDKSILPSLQAELRGLENLNPPEADQQTVDKMVASLARNIEEIEDQRLAAIGNSQLFAAFEKEAKAYGFDCGLA